MTAILESGKFDTATQAAPRTLPCATQTAQNVPEVAQGTPAPQIPTAGRSGPGETR
jgi:hypothetical protein